MIQLMTKAQNKTNHIKKTLKWNSWNELINDTTDDQSTAQN